MAAPNNASTNANTPATPDIRDYTALIDVNTFLEVFGDSAAAATEIEEMTAALVKSYNEDNGKGARNVCDWLPHSEAFPLGDHRFPTPPAPVFGKERRNMQNGDGWELSRLYAILGTFEATQRRKRENRRDPLRENEVDFQLKLTSTSFNTNGAADDVTTLPDNLRFDKWGFLCSAQAFVRMLRSSTFGGFVQQVTEQFAAKSSQTEVDEEEEEEDGDLGDGGWRSKEKKAMLEQSQLLHGGVVVGEDTAA